MVVEGSLGPEPEAEEATQPAVNGGKLPGLLPSSCCSFLEAETCGDAVDPKNEF